MLTLDELRALLDGYEAPASAGLDCQGQTHVCAYWLSAFGEPFSAYFGHVDCAGQRVYNHFWLEVDTTDGRARIDYRLRMWLDDLLPHEQIPHGCFLPRTLPDTIQYTGQPIHLTVLPGEVIHVLMTPPPAELLVPRSWLR